MSHRLLTLAAATALVCAAALDGRLHAFVVGGAPASPRAEASIEQSISSDSYPFCPTAFVTLGDFVAIGTTTFDTDLLTFGGLQGGVNINGVAVFAFDSIQIPPGTTVIGKGSAPLVLLSKSAVQIDGSVIGAGQSAISFSKGPFGGGPGGGAGGPGGLNPGIGLGAGLPASEVVFSGSGGAGFGGVGGAGGFHVQGIPGAGGVSYGALNVGLEGGSGGAGGSTGTGGGGGGGSLFISSLAGLTVGSSGLVSADGGNGAASGFGASGGGSGGRIVLRGLVVTNDGTARANGGHGGRGGGYGAGGGGGGGRIMVAGAAAGTGTYSLVGGKSGLGGDPAQNPGSLGQNGADGVLSIDPEAFPSCPPPPIQVFTTFEAELMRSRDAFGVTGRLILGEGSDGIDPTTEPVTLTVGSYTATLLPGAFRIDAANRYVFTGVVEGVSLNVIIVPTRYARAFGLAARARPVSLPSGPMTVTLTVGDDAGTTVTR